MNTVINSKAPVSSSGQIEINAPVSTVWKLLTEINNWPEWQKDVTHADVHGSIQEHTRFDWKASGLSFKSEIHTVNLYSEFGWTGKTTGTFAIHNWKFIHNGNKTILYVEESLEGFLPNIFRTFFRKSLDRGIQKNLKELKSAAEARS